MRCALRWVFVRDPAVSLQLFWHDVTKSFERISGRHFATCKRRVGILEDQWRAKFAARNAQGGLPGNNNSDLGRAMRAWIDFRDDEERAKKEIEEDVKALDVRRRRMHELEIERLGQTDVCHYETTAVGEEEEIGPQGIETTVVPQINGSIAHADSPEDGISTESRNRPNDFNLPVDLEHYESGKQPKATDQVAIIAELLRKRQRDEREEADIRREEQVLLNKRLAMMEEQMQMLSKLIKINTQREDDPLLASPPQQAAGSTDKDALSAIASETGAAAAQTRGIIEIDDTPADKVTHGNEQITVAPEALAGAVEIGDGTPETNGPTDVTADDTMDETADTSIEPGAMTGSADMDEGTSTTNATETHADAATNENAEMTNGISAELGNTISTSTAASPTSPIDVPEVSVAKDPDTDMPVVHEV